MRPRRDDQPRRRAVLPAGVAALAAVAVVAATPAAFADEHSYLTVTGEPLAEPVTVSADDHPDRYAQLHAEVGWLVDRPAEETEPDPETLGTEYELTLHAEGEPRHRFLLYPRAEGGPRVFRPAEQPGDDVDEGWFLGRLSLPERLAEVGVPVAGTAPEGGLGGGEETGENPATERGPLAFLEEWREGMLLTMALALAVLAGTASVALLLRRDR